MRPTLESFIDTKNIPKAYGGELDFKWGQLPNLDPAIREAVTWENGHTDFPGGPLYWRPIDEDRLECVAVGSINQVERMERVCTIPRSYKGVHAVVPEEANGQPGEVAQTESSATDAVTKSEEADTAGVTTGVETHPTEATTEADPSAEASGETDPAPPASNGTNEGEAPTITEVQGVQNLSIIDNEKSDKDKDKVASEQATAQATVA